MGPSVVARTMNELPYSDFSPFRHVGSLTADLVANLRFRRQVEYLHSLGPRAIAELLAEIGAERSIRTVIDRKLDRYSQLKSEALKATGGDAFCAPPLRKVEP